jgi:mannosyltransferase OCH1-like enzyme
VIERTVHRIWLGDSPEPEWTRAFAATWQRPGWELRQWDGPGELYPLRNQDVYDRAEEIAPEHVAQLRADVLRYEVLHRCGGVYVDVDFECLRPIDKLLEGVECFAAWEEQERWIANGFMGAARGHPFIDLLISELAAHVAAQPFRKPNRLTGPQYLTSMWRAHGKGVIVLPARLVYPYLYTQISEHGPGDSWPEAYAVHHWMHWRRKQDAPSG